MSAEGITYMAASGDSGTGIEPFSYPDYDPEVLCVGGTVANVDAVTGVRISEVNWTGGGGGWSTKAVAFNMRPSWQVGTGVPPITASNNKRLVPDVAFHSSGTSGAYQFFLNGGLTSAIGTSFAVAGLRRPSAARLAAGDQPRRPRAGRATASVASAASRT